MHAQWPPLHRTAGVAQAIAEPLREATEFRRGRARKGDDARLGPREAAEAVQDVVLRTALRRGLGAGSLDARHLGPGHLPDESEGHMPRLGRRRARPGQARKQFGDRTSEFPIDGDVAKGDEEAWHAAFLPNAQQRRGSRPAPIQALVPTPGRLDVHVAALDLARLQRLHHPAGLGLRHLDKREPVVDVDQADDVAGDAG